MTLLDIHLMAMIAVPTVQLAVVQPALNRLRREFLEMPGLCLTLPQASRFCGLDESTCKAVLDALVDAKFLRITADGTYARLTRAGGCGS